MTVFTPGPQGGTNWQPSSYNPNTHMFYVCAQSGVTGNTAGPPSTATKQGEVAAGRDSAATLTIAGGFGKNTGTFTAIDATTGKIVWQKKWPESCYAGSDDDGRATSSSSGATTAGCRPTTRRTATCCGASRPARARTTPRRSSSTTARSTSRSTPAAMRSPATPHGDNLWLFSLDGHAEPGRRARLRHRRRARGRDAEQTPKPDDDDGGRRRDRDRRGRAVVFADNCATCHGATGTGGNGGPDLTAIPSREAARGRSSSR